MDWEGLGGTGRETDKNNSENGKQEVAWQHRPSYRQTGVTKNDKVKGVTRGEQLRDHEG